MRLIDADGLCISDIDSTDIPEGHCLRAYTEEEVVDAPTVNAVPIGDIIDRLDERIFNIEMKEWLSNNDYQKIDKYNEMKAVLMDMYPETKQDD